MNKLLLVLLSVTLLILLTITGVLFFAFSPSGNDMLKPYIKERLEEKIGLPVEVHKFTLDVGKASAVIRINQQADVEIVTQYDLLAQSVNGIYRVKAKNFQYEDMLLRQLNLQGQFKGVADDIVIEGKGTALDAPLVYSLRVLEQNPQNIVAHMEGVSLGEILTLAGQPPLAEGKIDIDVNMPDIGEEFANGYGHIVLNKALFNSDIVKKMYDLTLPNESYVTGNVDMKLKGNSLNLLANANSNLFTLKIEDASIALKDKKVLASYVMDVKEMGILTKNQLSGALKILGNVEVDDEKYHLKGSTHSLGGALLFNLGEISEFHFENLELAKILHLTKQPVYAKGLLSGSGNIEKDMESGRYEVQVRKGQFDAKSIEENLGYQIPSVNNFTLQSEGKIAKKVLDADVSLKSSLSDIQLTGLVYNLDKKELDSSYDIFLPNIGLLMPDNKAVKRGYMSAKGEVHVGDTLVIKGTTKGLGEKLDFMYDSKTAKIDANGLFIEKLLSLAGLPRYVKGELSSKIEVNNIKTLDGTFTLKSDKLSTQAKAMEELIGKKLTTNIALESKGELKDGKAYLDTKIKTSMGQVTLTKMVADTKTKQFRSEYILNIPELKETYALTDKKLYGPMVLSGDITQDKLLNVTGETSSLGGKIEYTLNGDNLKSKINKVPVENILGMLGHDKLVQGSAQGTMTYNLKSKAGVLDIDIGSFQIKPNSTTNTVKMFIGKDPARIIYTSTKLHAKLKGDITTYTLIAKGSRSTIEITSGKIDKVANTHRAKFKFDYEKYSVTGSIGGTVDHPKILVDPSAVMQSKTGEKIQEKLDKALGGDMGKAVGGFLKGMKF